jgi:hypothetical protein
MEELNETQIQETETAYQNRYTPEEFKEIYETNPDVALREYVCEINQSNDIDINHINTFIDTMLTDNDNVNHIYQYLSKRLPTPAPAFTDVYPELTDESLKDILKNLKDRTHASGEEYKVIVESICQPIDDMYKKRIFDYVDAVIDTLILSTSQQKQYIISQHSTNGIETYHQLQQIMSLIDTCKIHSKDAIEYYNLYNYIIDNETISSKFTDAVKINNYEVEFRLIDLMAKWFQRYIQNESSTNDTIGYIDADANDIGSGSDNGDSPVQATEG